MNRQYRPIELGAGLAGSISMRVMSFALTVVVGLFVLAACNDVKHPLDDSETRPATAADAVTEATAMLDDMATTTMGAETFTEAEWEAAPGCATNPDSPEQGDVSRILYRTYVKLPGSYTLETLMADQRASASSASVRYHAAAR